jgi:hypothetical protein
LNWKWKSAAQRACAILPVGRDQTYYLLQRYCGGLVRGYDPAFMLREAARMAASLRTLGVEIQGARVMEVGTGWRMDLPLGLYLCGAETVHTYDTHQYARPSLVMRSVEYIRANRARILEELSSKSPAREMERRLDALCRVQNTAGLLETTMIQYHAPTDAAATGLPSGSVDIQLSYTVFEHIPGPVLEQILTEANRVLSDRGATIHHIDLSDHFFQVDPNITAINFLQYTDAEWGRYAGNQWAYHNRLRVHDYKEIYQRSGQEILKWSTRVDERELAAVRNGFPIDPKFRHITPEALCTIDVEAVSRPLRNPAGR